MEFEEVLTYMNKKVRDFKKPILFFLEGPLGAGKTYLARKFLEELGAKTYVVSPTFIISRKVPIEEGYVYHLDFYRVRDKMHKEIEDILEQIGFWDILDEADIVLIEWGDLLYNYLKEHKFNLPMFKINIDLKGKKRIYNIIQ